MFTFYDKLTPSQKLLLTALMSMLGAALVTTGTAVWQLYSSQQGQLNIAVLFGCATSTFLLLMSRELTAYVPAHAKDELQALQDTNNQLQNTNEQLHSAVARQQTLTGQAINKNVVQASQAQTSAAPVVHVYMPQQSIASVAAPADMSTIVNIPSVFSTSEPHVSDMATASVPVVSIASVDVPQVPFPDYAKMSWGDTGVVPAVSQGAQ